MASARSVSVCANSRASHAMCARKLFRIVPRGGEQPVLLSRQHLDQLPASRPHGRQSPAPSRIGQRPGRGRVAFGKAGQDLSIQSDPSSPDDPPPWRSRGSGEDWRPRQGAPPRPTHWSGRVSSAPVASSTISVGAELTHLFERRWRSLPHGVAPKTEHPAAGAISNRACEHINADEHGCVS